MRDPIGPDAVAAMYQCARRSAPQDALRALGALAIGRPAYLACKGYALHGTELGCDIVDPRNPDQALTPSDAFETVVLAPWGLRFSAVAQTAQPASSPTYLAKAVIALRLGLLMRCLDTAFLHLEGRESFGHKLLHHQLMKARFAATYADIARLLTELSLAPTLLADARALAMHHTISRHFTQAAKLMGGHGLLAGNCHALEFLAGLVFALHLPAETGQSTATPLTVRR